MSVFFVVSLISLVQRWIYNPSTRQISINILKGFTEADLVYPYSEPKSSFTENPRTVFF